MSSVTLRNASREDSVVPREYEPTDRRAPPYPFRRRYFLRSTLEVRYGSPEFPVSSAPDGPTAHYVAFRPRVCPGPGGGAGWRRRDGAPGHGHGWRGPGQLRSGGGGRAP